MIAIIDTTDRHIDFIIFIAPFARSILNFWTFAKVNVNSKVVQLNESNRKGKLSRWRKDAHRKNDKGLERPRPS